MALAYLPCISQSVQASDNYTEVDANACNSNTIPLAVVNCKPITLIYVNHNGDYLVFSKTFIYLCNVKNKKHMKVHIYLYRKGSLEVDEYVKDFKTQRSLNTFISKQENNPRYDSVEWYFER